MATETQRTAHQRETMLGVLNKVALVLLTRGEKSFRAAMSEGLDLIAGIAEIARMSVFRIIEQPSGLHLSQIYRWRKDASGIVDVWPQLNNVPYSAIAPQLRTILEAGEFVSGSVDTLPGNELFKQFGCVTVLLIPVFDEGKFWGAALFEKMRDADFSGIEIDTLRAASVVLTAAVLRNEESESIRRANEQSQLMLDSVPLVVAMWDKDLTVINCSQNAVRLLGFADRQDAIKRFVLSVPEFQPDGTRTHQRMAEMIELAFEQGIGRCEFTQLTVAGEPIVFDVWYNIYSIYRTQPAKS